MSHRYTSVALKTLANRKLRHGTAAPGTETMRTCRIRSTDAILLLTFNNCELQRVCHDEATDWLKFFISNDALSLLKVFAHLQKQHILSSLDLLKESEQVLVYGMANIRCVRRMMQWKCDDHTFVMHLQDTGLPATCVVQRKNQMLVIHNI